jgi:hypothetical protein
MVLFRLATPLAACFCIQNVFAKSNPTRFETEPPKTGQLRASASEISLIALSTCSTTWVCFWAAA